MRLAQRTILQGQWPICKTRIHSSGVAFKNLALLFSAEPRHGIDVALRIIEVMSGLRINASHGSHHFRSEQDVLDRHDLQQQLDAGQMIDTSIEKNVSADKFPQRRPIQVLGKTAITSPVVRDGAAAMRNNKSQSRKILEQ